MYKNLILFSFRRPLIVGIQFRREDGFFNNPSCLSLIDAKFRELIHYLSSIFLLNTKKKLCLCGPMADYRKAANQTLLISISFMLVARNNQQPLTSREFTIMNPFPSSPEAARARFVIPIRKNAARDTSDYSGCVEGVNILEITLRSHLYIEE
jgi:hypothetical protein